jgi:hypothetical protein
MNKIIPPFIARKSPPPRESARHPRDVPVGC